MSLDPLFTNENTEFTSDPSFLFVRTVFESFLGAELLYDTFGVRTDERVKECVTNYVGNRAFSP